MWGKFYRGGGFIPPVGLMSIASYIRQKGHDVRIVDTGVEGMDEAALEKFLKDERFDVVGIPCFTNTARYTFNTADLVKKALPGAFVVLGGVHATVLPEKSLEECSGADVIVIGEGEVTFSELLDWKSGKINSLENIDGIMYRGGKAYKRTKPRQLIQDLDSIPMASYDLLKMEKYLPHPTQYKRLPSFPILASRGCPFLCTFCSASKVHGRKLRLRGLDSVFQEIDYLIKEYGAKGLYIQDSSFINSRRYVVEFCERLLRDKYDLSWMCNSRVDQIDLELARLMKKAGCWQVTFGIESANDSSLKLIKKHQSKEDIIKGVDAAKKAGLNIMACYILGLPGETAAEVENTIDLARTLASHTALFFLPVPYPGTELLEQCRQDGGLREDVVWDDYSSTDFSNPIYVNPLLGKEKLLRYYGTAHKKFYSSPKVMVNNLMSIRSMDDVKRYWRAFNALLGLLG
ncbi:MAG: radical SAM protein [Candidatus Omnitrophota bacterium]